MSTTKKDPWYAKDTKTTRRATLDESKRVATRAQINASDLPEDVKAAALQALESQASSAKAFTLTLARAQHDGRTDLVAVEGDFKEKLLSPKLLRSIAQNADMVLNWLDKLASE